jgi:hypothetical protein
VRDHAARSDSEADRRLITKQTAWLAAVRRYAIRAAPAYVEWFEAHVPGSSFDWHTTPHRWQEKFSDGLLEFQTCSHEDFLFICDGSPPAEDELAELSWPLCMWWDDRAQIVRLWEHRTVDSPRTGECRREGWWDDADDAAARIWSVQQWENALAPGYRLLTDLPGIPAWMQLPFSEKLSLDAKVHNRLRERLRYLQFLPPNIRDHLFWSEL